MKIRTTISMLGTAALAGVLHFPTPCLPLDMGCHIEQAGHLHIHQDNSTLPPIDSKQMVIHTATDWRSSQ